MGEVAKNKRGESMPVMICDTDNMFNVDGSIAHAESAALPQGIYRIAVRQSTDDAGVMIQIAAAPSATTSDGMFIPQGGVEYTLIEDGNSISVIDGVINVVPMI